MNVSGAVIGIDLDNTIINYDKAIYALAVERGYVDPSAPPGSVSKKTVRDAVRRMSGDDVEWQKMQAALYTRFMNLAEPYPGAMEFVSLAKSEGATVFIVSHKTEYAKRDETRAPLRALSLDWLREHGFFDTPRTGLSPESVFFESTRREKLERIASLGCAAFVDDLREVFEEASFPANVERLLFAPSPTEEERNPVEGVAVLRSWGEIAERLLFPRPEALSQPLSLLLRFDVRAAEVACGGRNSRVYRLLRASDGASFAAKIYRRDASDARDRLNVEYNALSFLLEKGVRNIPRPLAASPELSCAVYGWVDGERIDPRSVDDSDIEQAVDFLALLDRLSGEAESAELPEASEACFTVADICRNLEGRFRALERVDDDALQTFLSSRLLPAMRSAPSGSRVDAAAPEALLSRAFWTLSPSDFGFHNALKDAGGRIHFLDFEYFGWDDPAKTVCDFLLHPAMNLTEGARRLFVQRILPVYRRDASLPERLRVVYPLYVLKWCVILLNEFLPERAARRRFSMGGGFDLAALRAEQLHKAELMLRKLEKGDEECARCSG